MKNYSCKNKKKKRGKVWCYSNALLMQLKAKLNQVLKGSNNISNSSMGQVTEVQIS